MKETFCRFSIVFFILISFVSMKSFAQLTVNTALTPQQLVQNVLLGGGVVASNVTYNGSANAIGSFNGAASNIGLASGVLITSGDVAFAPGPNSMGSAGQDNLLPGDADLDSLYPGSPTFDGAVLEFDFIPRTNIISFRYVFASEEYNEYVCASVNDIFAFFISGPGIAGIPNIARLPGGLPVAIDNVNNGTVGAMGSAGPGCNLSNSAYFVDNDTPPGLTVEYDGFTIVLTASAIVIPCQTYHIKIAIADVGDGVFDSGVFLEAGSFSSGTPVLADAQAGGSIFGCAPVVINFTNTSTGASSFLWDFGDGTTSTATTPSHLYNQNGTYQVSLIAYDPSACHLDDTVQITVTIGNSNVVPQFTSSQIRYCDSLVINLNSTSTGAQIFNWDFGDGTAATGSSFSHVYNSSGTFQVVLMATDTVCGVSDTAQQSFSFTIPPVVSAFATVSSTQGCIPFNVNFTDAIIGTPQFQWDFGDGSAMSTTSNPSHTYTAIGNYTATLIAIDTSICLRHDTITLNLVVTTGSAIPNFSVTQQPMCDSLVATLTNLSVGAHLYNWSFGDGTFATTQDVSHIYNQPGSYQILLTATDTICNSSDTISQYVIVNPVPVVTAAITSDVTTGCAPLLVNFTNLSLNSGQFTWTFGDATASSTLTNPAHTFLSSANYTVQLIAEDTSICQRNDTTTMVISPITVIVTPSFDLAQTVSCDSLVVDLFSTSTGGEVYNWNLGDGNSSSGISTSHAYYSPGTYTILLTVTDTICNVVNSITQTVVQYPPVHSRATTDIVDGCEPLLINYSDPDTLTSDVNLLWDFDNGQSASVASGYHTFTEGNYHITLVASQAQSCNGSDTDFVDIRVRPTPIANFSTNRVVELYEGVYLNNQTIKGNTYYWSFGDNTNSTAISPSHQYLQLGEFSIYLIAYNGGCVDTAYGSLEVVVGTLWVPNSFTPNGDELNDFFGAKALGVVNYDFRIYDRWGLEIFYSADIDKGWDGRYKGSDSPEDVYVFRLKAELETGQTVTRIGHVSLAR